MSERYVRMLFVVPLAVPASMLDDGGWIENAAREAIARGDWEIEPEAGQSFPVASG